MSGIVDSGWSGRIRHPLPEDRAEWERVWHAYLEGAGSVLPSAHTDLLWTRIQDDAHPIQCLVAEVPDLAPQLAGIVQFLPHLNTWEKQPVCYIQDMFVDPVMRRQGVGLALIRTVEAVSAENGWGFIYWQTSANNAVARSLYDEITGGATGHIVYRLGKGTDQPI